MHHCRGTRLDELEFFLVWFLLWVYFWFYFWPLTTHRKRVWVQRNEFNTIVIFAPVPSQKYAGYWLVLVILYNFNFLMKFGFIDMVRFHWFIHLTIWGHLERARWCEVPHCVEDRTVTPRYFVLCRCRWDAVSLTLTPFPFFFISNGSKSNTSVVWTEIFK